MPAQWNLPRTSNQWDIQDVERFQRLPVWMAMQQTKKLPFWSRWGKMFGSIKWQPNMGDILQGVIAEPSPVASQKHTPRNITQLPLKTKISHFERSNQARVKRHNYESDYFHFLPSFRDYRTRQVKFAIDDLTRQVAIGNEFFIRWQVLQQAKNVMIVGAANDSAVSNGIMQVPAGEATDTSEPKDADLFATIAGKVGNATGFLDFVNITGARTIGREVIGMLPWEGAPSAAGPKENEIVKGKWLLIGEALLYENLTFDQYALNFKDYAMNLLNDTFRGIISGNIVFMQERYPLFFKADGTFPQPEIEQNLAESNPSGINTGYEVVPNPEYVNAPFGIAFLVGHQPFETLQVGPPPSEFAGGSISMGKFRKLNWNGEVRVTDDLLIDYSGVKDTNKYGEFLQLIADVTHGIIANTPRFILPIVYRRVLRPGLTVPT